MILEAIDGGYNWNAVIENLSAPLNAFHFKDSVGWAVGDNGLVLRTDNWTTWINPKTGEINPSKYSLFQNYPNPFNPVTVISWQLAVSSPVKLTIYNLIGQKVMTLVDQRKPAGKHSIRFNGARLASGIYFYRLQAGNYSSVKKMILQK